MKQFMFGHCLTGFHHLCKGTLDRPKGEVATCTCPHHKEKSDGDDR